MKLVQKRQFSEHELTNHRLLNDQSKPVTDKWYNNKHWLYNDGGKSTSLKKDDNRNCAVRALAIAFGLEYDHAYYYLMACGREHGRGTRRTTTDAVIKIGCALTKATVTKVVLPKSVKIKTKDFCESAKDGVYLICQYGHILCVIDGVCQDTFPSNNTIIEEIYKVDIDRDADYLYTELNVTKQDYQCDF